MLTKDKSGNWTWTDAPTGHVVKIEMHYTKRRGAYVTVREVHRSLERGYPTETYMLLDPKSVTVLVLPMERGNAGRLAKLAAAFNPHLSDIATRYRSATKDEVRAYLATLAAAIQNAIAA